MKATRDEIYAAVQLLVVVGDAIRDLSAVSPLGGVPSGELYAHLMGYLGDRPAEVYDAIIRRLKGAGLVKESNHLLTWCGPVVLPDKLKGGAS